MDKTGTTFLPPDASTFAMNIDNLLLFITIIAVFFLSLIVGLIILFVLKYRRKGKAGLTSGLDRNTKLEVIWTVVPSILLVIIFGWGFTGFLEMQVVPKDAFEIKVTARQWFWNFVYPNGANIQNELVVPVDTPVRLLMSSEDVIHSLFIPAFRLKMDVVPNRYSITWFESIKKGTYNIFCAEYCGTLHSEMTGIVRVVSESEFTQWMNETLSFGEGLTPEQFGAKLYTAKACNTCHSIDGKADVGPTFKGVFGHEVTISDGSVVIVDENYIRESILNPSEKIVSGYQSVMPTYQGIIKQQEIDAIIAFIKSLSEIQ